jgi:hypothetical protein
VERPGKGSDVEPPSSWGVNDVLTWLSSLATSIRDGEALEKDADLFEQGFDRSAALILYQASLTLLPASPQRSCAITSSVRSGARLSPRPLRRSTTALYMRTPLSPAWP